MLSSSSLRRLLAVFVAGPVWAQSFELRPVEPNSLPALVDSNTPAFWRDGGLSIFSSTGEPLINTGPDQFSLGYPMFVDSDGSRPSPLWIEAAWQDSDGALFLWYHHEQLDACPGTSLTVPKIGAAVSYDGGRTLRDLGFVLESGEAPDCGSRNGYFAGGHGDFSVILNPVDGYFYFLFSNYGGAASEQGVAIARMPFERRFDPASSVEKYYRGRWEQPGLGGHVTPVFAARVDWQREDTDAFWGPSIHWNTHLEQYVVLMNRACCAPDWPQEGVYVAFNRDISNPSGWTAPDLMVPHGGWYPQVLGVEAGETDTVAGRTPRLYVRGFSEWEIVFFREDELTESDK